MLSVDVTSETEYIPADFWRFGWNFTFYKLGKLAVKNPVFEPWNIITIDCVHSRLQNEQNYADFINCVKSLILAIRPIYASIDDIANKVALLEEAGERHYVPDRIQQIYWGNYFGRELCNAYNITASDFPVESAEEFGEGILVLLTNHALDYSNPTCEMARKKVQIYIENCAKQHK